MDAGSAANTVLDIRDLRVWIRTRGRGVVKAVDGVSLVLQRGEMLGLVGESGSGKTMTGLTIMRLEPRTATIEAGQILFGQEDLTTKSNAEMSELRGKRIAMVLQDPMTSLDPSFTIGYQISETVSRHHRLEGGRLRERVLDALKTVRMPSASHRVHSYPHQLSGGMRQRAASAIALSCQPDILIADEPTTALDVTIEAQYLQLLKSLQHEMGLSIILISHDLDVIRRVCDSVAVMYGGQIVERGTVDTIFRRPAHPYTRALLNCVPAPGRGALLEAIEGQPPDPARYPPGCRFAPRCEYARDLCRAENPALTDREEPGHVARCWGTEPDGWITDERASA